MNYRRILNETDHARLVQMLIAAEVITRRGEAGPLARPAMAWHRYSAAARVDTNENPGSSTTNG